MVIIFFINKADFYYLHFQPTIDSSVSKVAILQGTGSPHITGFPWTSGQNSGTFGDFGTLALRFFLRGSGKSVIEFGPVRDVHLKKGCKQGAVNGLFQKPRERRSGCRIDLHNVCMQTTIGSLLLVYMLYKTCLEHVNSTILSMVSGSATVQSQVKANKNALLFWKQGWKLRS